MDAIGTFTLKEWQIWRQYTTYFVEDLPRDQIAARLVRDGIASCARAPRGALYWRQDGQVREATPVIETDANGKGIWKLPHMGEIDPFVRECLHQAAWFQGAEDKLLTEPVRFPSPYVLGFVGECTFQDAKRFFAVYPVIRLYANGVLQVLLRMLSPDRDVELPEFVREYGNAPKHLFDRVLAPPGFVKAVMRRDLEDPERCPRVGVLRRARLVDEFSSLIDESTSRRGGGDFSFDLAPIYIKGITPAVTSAGVAFSRTRERENGYALAELAHTIVALVSHSLGSRRGASGRRVPLKQGSFWMGRPHTYVTLHSDQCETAADNEELHGPAMGCILAGVLADTESQARAFLPKSGRTFEDYGFYVTKAATLVVWSGLGCKRSDKRLDANRGDLVYEQHVLAQAMDYGYMMYRRALEYALSMKTTAEAVRGHQDLVAFLCGLQDATLYGELNDLLNAGWRAMGTDELQRLTSEALEARTQALAERDSRRQGRWGLVVSAILGVLATTGIADQVVSPIWRWRSWPLPGDERLAGVVLWAVTLAIVTGVLALAWGLFSMYSRLRD